MPQTIPSSQILNKMTLSLSMSMPVNGDYAFYIDKLRVPTHERPPPPSFFSAISIFCYVVGQ